jgi:ribonuclease BN (tRNA processing enzyme)
VKEVRFPRPVGDALPSELALRVGGVTLRGTSIGARATAFAVPELGVALDVGRMSPAIAAQPVVLLSHAHLDHLSGVLAYLNVRARFYTGEPTRLVVPEPVAAPLRQALKVLPGMESVRKRLDLDAAICAVGAGERVALPSGSATPFEVDHGVPALGWALRRASEARPVLVYAADGLPARFKREPELLDARAAVVECSFLDANRRIAAQLSKHAHVKDWIELAPVLRADTLVLAHLPETSAAAVAARVAPLVDACAGRVVVWLSPR